MTRFTKMASDPTSPVLDAEVAQSTVLPAVRSAQMRSTDSWTAFCSWVVLRFAAAIVLSVTGLYAIGSSFGSPHVPVAITSSDPLISGRTDTTAANGIKTADVDTEFEGIRR